MDEAYRIRINGRLVAHWAGWFDGMTITPLANGETLIEGPSVDRAALHGMLNHIRDLGLPLLAVDRVEPHEKTGGAHASGT
ncbi:MAG TPA: hypothetical protein VMP08_17905 [Anaerolineae bacterium]|nr:hypothetical protein [Anaerolineae bacterium]